MSVVTDVCLLLFSSEESKNGAVIGYRTILSQDIRVPNWSGHFGLLTQCRSVRIYFGTGRQLVIKLDSCCNHYRLLVSYTTQNALHCYAWYTSTENSYKCGSAFLIITSSRPIVNIDNVSIYYVWQHCEMCLRCVVMSTNLNLQILMQWHTQSGKAIGWSQWEKLIVPYSLVEIKKIECFQTNLWVRNVSIQLSPKYADLSVPVL
jgi:hypothetical protein